MNKLTTKPSKAERLICDLHAANFSLLLIMGYIALYGALVSKGFRFELSPAYLTILIPIFLVDGVKSLLEALPQNEFVSGTEDTSKITVIIPTYNGGYMLGEVLRDLLKRFAAEQIIVSSNGSNDNTVAVAMRSKVKLLIIPTSVGKARALNNALDQVTTPYVLVIDDDTFIGNAVLPISLLDDNFEAVAFRVMPKSGNWLATLQTYEYRKSMDIGRCFHNRFGTVHNVSGAIGLFKIEELRRQITIHTNENSGEDLQRTLLIHRNRTNRGVVITDSIIYTDVPNTLGKLYRQRILGWHPGLLSNINNYLRLLTGLKTPISLRYDAFYNLIIGSCGDYFRLVSLPILLFYPGYFPIYYVSYVLIETIVYRQLKCVDPYWVVLVYPFYGLFNLITRLEAISVLLFRRLTAIFGRCPFWDDYKTVNIRRKFLSNLATNLTILMGFTFIVYLQVPNGVNFSTATAIQVTENKLNSTPSNMIIVAERGDGLWSLSLKAIDGYIAINGKNNVVVGKNGAVAKLMAKTEVRRVYPSDTFEFKLEDIEAALASL